MPKLQNGEQPKELISARVGNDLKSYYTRVALARGVTVTALVEKALAEYRKRHPNPLSKGQ